MFVCDINVMCVRACCVGVCVCVCGVRVFVVSLYVLSVCRRVVFIFRLLCVWFECHELWVL